MILIGTRPSNLAVMQGGILAELIAFPSQIKKIRSSGDRIRHMSLADIGGKGLFVKELEEALIRKEIDIAVHSIKDLPYQYSDDLIIPCIIERIDPRDVFISHKHQKFCHLEASFVVGTCAPRRIVQLKCKSAPIRGNVETRLYKGRSYDGIILAAAGLIRLGLDSRITDFISTEDMLPAVGQGAICAQCRREDLSLIESLMSISDKDAEVCINTERAFVEFIQGDCNTPIAGLCIKKEEDILYFRGMLHYNGKTCFVERSGNISDAERLGKDAAIECCVNLQVNKRAF